MSKKINAILFVLLYIVMYFISLLLSIIARPVSDAVLMLINGEHNLYRLSEHFIYQIQGQAIDVTNVYFTSMVLTVLLIWFIINSRKKSMSDYVHKRRLSFKDILACMLLAYGLNVVATVVISIPAFEDFLPSYESSMESISMGNVYALLIIVGILAPAFEELFFRGFIYGELKFGGGFLFANIIQSVLFGFMHLNVIQGIYAAIIGFVLGFVYYKTENIYLTILTHIIFNASNILVSGLFYYAQNFPLYYLSGIVTLIIAFMLIFNKRQLDNNLS
ncbi:MAG: CPBP family intramembrane metalloprotease [Clostridia bacterium]|nr:CPBP family intramembrane metalloprotease [Clostridia bacterium]